MSNDRLSECKASQEMLEKAKHDNVETLWDRYTYQQPQCNYGQLGICCRNCNMGPCRIDPFGRYPDKGICGAKADSIVARNLLLQIATGAAAHSDHGREIVYTLLQVAQGKVNSYKITDELKLRNIAKEVGIDPSQPVKTVALELAIVMFHDFGRQIPVGLSFLARVPEKRFKVWEKCHIIPRGIDREIVESLHRTHIGVDNDAVSLLSQGIRTGLADGWAGSMAATEISDILFGTPKPKVTQVNLGVLKENMVNLIVHGHDPTLSELIAQTAYDNELIRLAKSNGAEGINVCGMCCTGNEILARHGFPVAGNFAQQEMAIITGAVEAIVVDIQCILPSLTDISKCYHTKLITTSSKANFPGAVSMQLDDSNPCETVYRIVETAINNFPSRKKEKVQIPQETMEAVVGFSTEAILALFGGSIDTLVGILADGQVRGIAAVVGCNNPKVKYEYNHINVVKELISRDILVVTTGCNAIACAKAGLLSKKSSALAGENLKSVCEQYSIPPVLHMGSCVDISRILTVIAALAKHLKCDISDLPVAGAAPEWMSQKAVSIASYMVGSGICTVLGVIPQVLGSKVVTDFLCDSIEPLLGAKFLVEPDPFKAANLIYEHIESKRKALFSEKLIKVNCLI